MDVEFFPKRARLDRNMWTDNDRNLSHFLIKTYTDFARYGLEHINSMYRNGNLLISITSINF